jgi:hypothetical protein
VVRQLRILVSQFRVLRTGTLSEIRPDNMYQPLPHILKIETMKKTNLFILMIIGLILFTSNRINASSNENNSSSSYTFILTHLLDKKLTKNAYFTVGDMKVWELDFRNGEKIKYTIISMNPDNPMCGITARDNFGDTCEICITKTSGDNTKVEFKYNGKRLTYKGYLLR